VPLAVWRNGKHGFKHSMAIGEAVAQVIHDGKSEIDLSPFNLIRFLQPSS
jgi:sarcosine oxidase